MQTTIQLAVFLENKPGTLAAVCDAMAAAGVNIYALTISDTVDHSVIRMIVSDVSKAVALLEERGTLVIENEVLMIENDNKPGTLSRIAKKLAAKDVNIEYAYLATSPRSKKGLMILRPSNFKKALALLSDE